MRFWPKKPPLPAIQQVRTPFVEMTRIAQQAFPGIRPMNGEERKFYAEHLPKGEAVDTAGLDSWDKKP